MKKLIECNSITKRYDFNEVLSDFSYSFNETGLYVLFGSSGSGKTTLLNTLLGLNEFENGDIIFNGKKYTSKVSNEDISSLVGYVAQDSFFIDYLTVKENIIISCPSVTEKEIITYMDRFKLTDKLLSYPNQLSGGERQRLSLIQSLLKNKKYYF